MSISYAETARRRSPESTQLLDRSVLADELDRRTAAGVAFSVALLGITDLEAVARNVGRYAGDVVVREVGIRLVELAERHDAVAAQLDMQEFVILLPELAEDELVAMAWAMHEMAGDLLVVQGNWIMPTTSVGTTTAAPGEEPAHVLHRAGVAMTRATKTGSVVAAFASDVDASTPSPARPWARPYRVRPGVSPTSQAGAA